MIRDAQAAHSVPPVGRRRPRVLYATQAATDPPTFTLFVTHELPLPYLRYLERKIREAFDFGPTPMKLRIRRRSESGSAAARADRLTISWLKAPGRFCRHKTQQKWIWCRGHGVGTA